MLFGKYVNKYYLKYAILFILGIAALIAVDWIQTYIPEFLGKVIKVLNEYDDKDLMMQEIAKLGLYTIAVAGGMFLGRFIWRITLFNASFRIEAEMRHEMFLKAEALPRQYYHDTKVGSIMSWFTNDLETISEYFSWGTIMMVDAIFLGVITTIKMVTRIDLWMTLICFAPLLLIIIWGFLAEKFFMKKWEERQNAYDKVYDFAQENFTGIRVIKAFVKETKEIHAFAKVARKSADTNVSFARLSVVFDVFIEVIISLLFALVLGVGGWFVWSYTHNDAIILFNHTIDLTPDKLIEFVGYIDILIWPMIALGQIVPMYSRSKASLKRVSVFLDAEIKVKSPKDGVKLEKARGEIEFKNFSFHYPTYDYASLHNISLTIHPGETVGIVGKIGCGKTTLVNVLLMMYNVEPGTLFVDGHDIMSLDIDALRNQIAYVPQDNFLFSDTIQNNINFGLENGDEEIARKGAIFAGVDEDINGFKDGYQTVSGERGVTLSGGQKQRISIARAYVKDAPILILDDSVSAVDTKTEETILHNIMNERRDRTTLVVASRVSTVSHLDKIIVLNEGELEAFDTPANLLKTSPTYIKMVKLQELQKEVEGGK